MSEVEQLKKTVAELREALAYLKDDYIVHTDPWCGCNDYKDQLCPYCTAEKVLESTK